jgi:hypothetical protein
MRVQLTDAQKREGRERQKRAFAALTDTYRRLGEAIGLALICPERACARADGRHDRARSALRAGPRLPAPAEGCAGV